MSAIAPGEASTDKKVGWFDERLGLSTLKATIAKNAGKPVPARLSWLYTAGSLAAFFFAIQFVTGFLMLMYYVPRAEMAFESVQRIETEVPLGWLIRQMHVWGSHFIVIVLVLHMFKVMWYGSYKRPREFTWVVGCLLFAVTLGFCFSGYLLPWNQLAFWGTKVGVATIDSIPYIGPSIKEWVCGSPDVSPTTMGRFFALHVIVLPAVLVGLLAVHLALVTKHGIAPKTSTKVERDLGYLGALEKNGAEPFFPRQIYRELFVLNLGFGLLVTAAYFLPIELGDPKSLETPAHIKPEWYFLPVYQLLKYFDDALYNALPFLGTLRDEYQIGSQFLGFCVVNLVAGALVLLPFLDRGRHRKMARRPLFALFALFLAITVLGLGVLGHVSGETYTIAGSRYRFSTKGYPSLVEKEATEDGAAADGDEASAPAGAKAPASANAPAEVGEGAAAGGEAVAAAPKSFREDGLPPGGTCASSDCHEHDSQHDEWLGSVHFENRVQCVDCHGGIDTAMPTVANEWEEDFSDAFDKDLAAEFFAHLGVHRNRRGGISTPSSSAVPELCGKCHSGVLAEFSSLHVEEVPEGHSKKSCIRCHSNHAVTPAGDATWKDGYTDPADPRTAAFDKMRDHFASLTARLAQLDGPIDELAELGAPVDDVAQERAALAAEIDGQRYLVHSLDLEKVSEATASVLESADRVTEVAKNRIVEIKGRGKILLWTWAGVLFLNLLIAARLLSLPKPPAPKNGTVNGGGTGDGTAAGIGPSPRPAITSEQRNAPAPASSPPVFRPGGTVADALGVATLPDELFEIDEEDEAEVSEADRAAVERVELAAAAAAQESRAQPVAPDVAGSERIERTESIGEPGRFDRPVEPTRLPVLDLAAILRLGDLPDELFETEEETLERRGRSDRDELLRPLD